jgi:hypothetical protein
MTPIAGPSGLNVVMSTDGSFTATTNGPGMYQFTFKELARYRELQCCHGNPELPYGKRPQGERGGCSNVDVDHRLSLDH